MSFISKYKSEYRSCRRDFFEKSYCAREYKQDKRYKSGVKEVGTTIKFRNKNKYELSFGDVIARLRYRYSLAEGLAQLNFCWLHAFIAFNYASKKKELLLFFLLGLIVPYYPVYNIYSYIRICWISEASVINKLLLSLYSLLIATVTLAIYVGIVYGSILLVRNF